MVHLDLDETVLADISYSEFSEWLEKLDATQFEYFIGDVYEGMGYSAEVTQPSKDRGIDVHIQDEDEVHLIQVKLKRNGKIGADVVDQLIGAANRQCREVTGVVLVTNSSFTNGAKRRRDDHLFNGRFDVELVNGVELYEKVANHDLFYLMDDHIPPSRRRQQLKDALRQIKSNESVQ